MSLNPSFTYIERGSEVQAAVQQLHKLPICGLDIETTGLDPQHDQILLIQLGTADHVFVFDSKATRFRAAFRSNHQQHLHLEAGSEPQF